MDAVIEKAKELAAQVLVEEPVEPKKKRVMSEGEEDDDEVDEDEDGNIIRSDENLKLDDEFDDTYGEIPEGYIIDDSPAYVDADELAIVNGMDKEAELQKPEPPKPVVEIKKEEPKDEWGF